MPAPVETLDALAALIRAKISLVVVGVGGINFYARDASDVVATEDLDVVLEPHAGVLRSALEVLQGLGFEFMAGDEPFPGFRDEAVLADVIRTGASLRARNASGAALDLMPPGLGLAWADLSADAVSFRLGDVEIRVGRLERLLHAKELAGRPQDVEFLRMFIARLAGRGF